jgi:hypothetical protein
MRDLNRGVGELRGTVDGINQLLRIDPIRRQVDEQGTLLRRDGIVIQRGGLAEGVRNGTLPPPYTSRDYPQPGQHYNNGGGAVVDQDVAVLTLQRDLYRYVRDAYNSGGGREALDWVGRVASGRDWDSRRGDGLSQQVHQLVHRELYDVLVQNGGEHNNGTPQLRNWLRDTVGQIEQQLRMRGVHGSLELEDATRGFAQLEGGEHVEADDVRLSAAGAGQETKREIA